MAIIVHEQGDSPKSSAIASLSGDRPHGLQSKLHRSRWQRRIGTCLRPNLRSRETPADPPTRIEVMVIGKQQYHDVPTAAPWSANRRSGRHTCPASLGTRHLRPQQITAHHRRRLPFGGHRARQYQAPSCPCRETPVGSHTPPLRTPAVPCRSGSHWTCISIGRLPRPDRA